MRGMNKLTAMAVKAQSKPGCYADGGGLYLQVSAFGTKAWLFRFMRDGRARKMGLGPVHTVTLAMAREKATNCRRQLLDEIDPIEARKSRRTKARLETARAMTFRQCAESYIKAHRAGWKNDKHAAQWPSTLAAYVYPVFGELPVAAIDTALVVKTLEPIWTEKPETAGRVRGRIESVLDWAAARGYRDGENPARWKGHLQNLLPAKSKVARVNHHAALPYAEHPAFMADLRARDGVGARALEFAILSATRTTETIEARWNEIDLKAKVWTIPAERMKAGREHRVPLSTRAVEILEVLPREAEHVFIADNKSKALLATLKRMGRGDLTAHGFRSTFRDWAAETTAYPAEVVEMALAHTIKDKAEAAYRRGDLFEKRRRLMADWAGYCAAPIRTGDVVPMRGLA